MKLGVFSSKQWVREAFDHVKADYPIDIHYLEPKLGPDTARLAKGYDAVCVFVNDEVTAGVLEELAEYGVKAVALRCAGYNNVDIRRAQELGISVVRVPEYSPYAVAEHTLGLILALNRRFHRAYTRVRDGNFALDGLLGFDIHNKTVGIIGTGKIGRTFAGLLTGFGAEVIAYDKFHSTELAATGVEYVDLEDLYRRSDIISLHCPLTHETYHLINEYAIRSMKRGVMIINTSRGPLIDSEAVIDGLKVGKIGYLGLDVYEEEGELFFEDLSDEVIQDDTFVRLQTFPNVLITAHQAFFTREAVGNIAATTMANLAHIKAGTESPNQVTV